MYNRLQFKIILILVSFIISVMAVVGSILLNNVYKYYTNDFVSQLDQTFGGELKSAIENTFAHDNYVERIQDTLYAYSRQMGIDPYRDYYILNTEGEFLGGSSEENFTGITRTHNLIMAISGISSSQQFLGSTVMDWALCIDNPDADSPVRGVIIYIADTQEEMKEFSWMIFSILMQSLLIGLVIAVILSFLLAKAITSPIKNITDKATKIAEGNFSEKLSVYSEDEIGILTRTFNQMASELKTTLEEISTEREKLQTIFSYLKDCVIAFDAKGGLLHINPTAQLLFRAQKDFTLENLIAALNIDCTPEELETGEDGTKSFLEIPFQGRVFDVSLGRFSFDIADNPFKGYIAVIHDVTEHFELEKSRREFIATVSHELGTPLTGIKGAAETIENNPDMPREIKSRFLKMVVGESDRMTRIVKDLLVLSRLDNQRVMWKLSSFSLPSLLAKCTDLLKTEAEKSGHTLLLDEMPEHLPELVADKERIEQVVINITQNALKYTPDNGRIETALHYAENIEPEGLRRGSYFRITVTDNGVGIPREDISRIFERFYRVDKARSSDKGGTGLGLSIAKEIVTAHGGGILIDSTVGAGTTVTIYLPQTARISDAAVVLPY